MRVKNMDQNVSVLKDLWKKILLFKEINLIFLSKVNYAWMFIWKQRRKGVSSILVDASKQKNYFIQKGFVKDYIKKGFLLIEVVFEFVLSEILLCTVC